MQNDIISPLLIPSGLFYEPFSCRSHNGRLTNRPLLYLCLSRVESMSTSVHTWCPCTGAWAPAQKSVAFRHCVLQVPKGHLVPEYKVETLYHGENPGVSTTWKKNCVHSDNHSQAPCSSTKCEHSLLVYGSSCHKTYLFRPLFPKMSMNAQKTTIFARTAV